MTWEAEFVGRLSDAKLPNVFNPYSEVCQIHDLPNAPAIRRANLAAMLELHQRTGIDSIWFGRDLGHRGGRRTGLPLTDEVAMLAEASVRGLNDVISRATHGAIVSERTAAIIWSMIHRLSCSPLLWNAFPLHPHAPGDSLTNRSHSAQERRMTAWAIEALIGRFKSPRLVAIGNDASKALSDLGFDHETARHPSYGGQREFIQKIELLYGLAPTGTAGSEPRMF
jgi:hypothetical protein